MSIHDRLAQQQEARTSQIDDERESYPDQEILPKGTIHSNYRPITCLPLRWKILTILREEIYYVSTISGRRERLLQIEQEGNDQLHID